MTKKKLLILWGNPYIFHEAMMPMIPKLAQKFRVSIIMVNTYMSSKIKADIEGLRHKGVIDGLWIIPSPRYQWKDLFRHHRFVKSHLKDWRKENFDLCMAYTGAEVFERYVIECVLPGHCRKICFYPSLTYLLNSGKSSRSVLNSMSGSSLTKRKNRSLLRRAKSTYPFVVSRVNDVFKRFKLVFVHRCVLPFFVVKKIFLLSRHEKESAISPKFIDALIFVDPCEAGAYKSLFPQINMHIVKYPSDGVCKCNGKEEQRSAILFPLSTGICNGNEVSEDMFNIISRDLKAVIQETHAHTVHLRLHPREKEKWPFDLERKLNSIGINAKCIKNDKPFRETMCDYLGMVSLASNALRDARAACRYAFIIGMLGPSGHLRNNVKQGFGTAEGIGWIEENGAYNPSIFERKRFQFKCDLSLDGLLEKMAYA